MTKAAKKTVSIAEGKKLPSIHCFYAPWKAFEAKIHPESAEQLDKLVGEGWHIVGQSSITAMNGVTIGIFYTLAWAN